MQGRLFAYGVTVGALTITFLIVVNLLIMQRRLLPGLMMMFSFVLLVLYLVGVIETGIILFGNGNVQRACQQYVNNNVQSGASQSTLAYIAQQNICKQSDSDQKVLTYRRPTDNDPGNCWYAVFSFWLVGVFFYIWMLVMAAQVARGDFDRPA